MKPETDQLIIALSSVMARCGIAIGKLTAFSCFFVSFLTTLLLATRVQAGDLKDESVEHMDVILVLDSSASMRLTDPQRLRDEGAKLFLQFLRSGDRLGVLEFSEAAKSLRPLSDYDPSQLDATVKTITAIGNDGQYTDINKGLAEAQKVLGESGRADAAHIVILLSDGKLDPNPNAITANAALLQLTDQLLPQLKTAGVKIYTLAFSDQADKQLLSEIAATTEAVSWFTPDADKIHESYANLFLAVKKPQVVPLGRRGFKIDTDIQEATFYISRSETQELTLISPSGKHFSKATAGEEVKWFRGQKFDVVTAVAPEPGEWQLEGISSSDGFATVLTNLKLITNWPNSVFAEGKTLLQAQLYESEKPIALSQMSGTIDFAFQITPTDRIAEPIMSESLVDDGTHGDKVASDGVFSKEITISEAGEYKLRILARGPTFERNQQIPFRVRPEFLTLRIESPDPHAEKTPDLTHSHADESSDQFVITADPEIEHIRQLSVGLIAIDKQKRKFSIPVSAFHGSKNEFAASASVLPADGEYELQAFLKGEDKRRAKVNEVSRILKYEKVTPVVEGHAEELVEKPENTGVVALEGPKEPEAPSTLIPIIIQLLIGLIGGGLLLLMITRMQFASASSLPALPPLDRTRAMIEELRAKLALREVDLNDKNLLTAVSAVTSAATTAQVESSSTENVPGEESAQGSSGDSQ